MISPRAEGDGSMSQRVFDVQQTAEYLNLSPAEVARFVEKGRLPGRRVAGEWRFHQAELDRWLEERIGQGPSEDLAQWEQALSDQVARSDADAWPGVTAICPLESMAVPLLSKTRKAVIRDMCELAARSGLLWDAEAMSDAVEARESLHPTALESGVALLHARRPQASLLAESFIALGITPYGLPFGESSGVPTDIFFLLCSRDDRSHLQALARISRMLAAGLPKLLREAATPEAAKAALQTIEQPLLNG
jgi:PTS system nitrogen regulatory IIA component